MSASRATPRPTVILATLVAIAIVLAVLATAATVIVASDVTRERERLQEAGTLTSLTVDEARREAEGFLTMRALVDTLVAELAPFAVADSPTIKRMTVLWGSTRQQRAAFATTDIAPADTPRVAQRELIAFTRVLAGEASDSAVVLDSTLQARALADTASVWLATWRTFARSAPLPPFWGYRDALPGVTSAFDLPTRNVGAARHLALLNELAGRHALRSGNAQAARLRALENIAASRHYLDSPLLLDFMVGRAFALTGARLARDAAQVLGDTALLRRLDQFATTTGSASTFTALRRAAERDAASPDGTLAYELFDDEKLPFAVRVEILYAAVAGACNHTREVLFGFDPSREARLTEVAARHASHPVMGRALALLPPAARRVREAPTSLLSESRWPSGGALDGVLPEGVAARAVLCQQGF